MKTTDICCPTPFVRLLPLLLYFQFHFHSCTATTCSPALPPPTRARVDARTLAPTTISSWHAFIQVRFISCIRWSRVPSGLRTAVRPRPANWDADGLNEALRLNEGWGVRWRIDHDSSLPPERLAERCHWNPPIDLATEAGWVGRPKGKRVALSVGGSQSLGFTWWILLGNLPE